MEIYQGLSATLADHIFAALLIVVFPIYALLSAVGLGRARDSGSMVELASRRGANYQATAFWLTGIGASAIAVWFVNDRPFAALGLADRNDTVVQQAALVAAAAFGMLQLYRIGFFLVRTDRDAEVLGQIEGFVSVLPHKANELGASYVLSVFAGVFEEIVYRGYLIWYLSTRMSFWAAVVVAAFVFALSHAYEGPRAMTRVALAALLFSALYIATGSLLAPILVHIFLDVGSFTIAFLVLRRAPAATPAEPK